MVVMMMVLSQVFLMWYVMHKNGKCKMSFIYIYEKNYLYVCGKKLYRKIFVRKKIESKGFLNATYAFMNLKKK